MPDRFVSFEGYFFVVVVFIDCLPHFFHCALRGWWCTSPTFTETFLISLKVDYTHMRWNSILIVLCQFCDFWQRAATKLLITILAERHFVFTFPAIVEVTATWQWKCWCCVAYLLGRCAKAKFHRRIARCKHWFNSKLLLCWEWWFFDKSLRVRSRKRFVSK